MHAQFEMIHPFLDGNGRMGRLLITTFLAHKKILTTPCFYMSSYLQSHRDRYYETLGLISKEKKWNPWIEFFLSGVIKHCSENERLLWNMTKLKKNSHLQQTLRSQLTYLTSFSLNQFFPSQEYTRNIQTCLNRSSLNSWLNYAMLDK